jgi:hypothetical protein
MLAAAVGAGAATSARAPLPIWQRVLIGGEYTGFTPQALPPTMLTRPAFVKQAQSFFDTFRAGQVAAEIGRDGYRGAVIENLTGPHGRNAISTAIRLGSSFAAVRSEKFFDDGSLRPCLRSCTVSAFELQVPGIPGALGAKRIRTTAEGPKPGQQPFELDLVFFTDGPFAYSIFSSGPQNGVNRSQLFAAARRLYARVKDSPPVDIGTPVHR